VASVPSSSGLGCGCVLGAKVMRRMATIAARVERRYAAIVAEAIAFHEHLPPFGKPRLRNDGTPSKRPVARRTGHNLAIRMRDRKAEVLRFVHDLSVPFTNIKSGSVRGSG
jgi:hypothetical protein